MNIFPLKAFEDNYIWLIEKDEQVIVVDPGQAHPVIEYLKTNKVTLKAILLTHKHKDHINGVESIKDSFPMVQIYGPVETNQLNTHQLNDGETFTLLDESFKVVKTPGHSEEHISYLVNGAVFSGDALFSAGCGRVFTGDYKTQYETLQFFNNLNEDTKLYGGHEYTVTNLNFALTVREKDPLLESKLEEAHEKLDKGQPTYPSTIGNEKDINLFLQAKNFEDFKKLRDLRDNF